MLLERGARSWIADEDGKLPADHANESEGNPDQPQIIELFEKPRITDPAFQKQTS